MIQPVSLEVSDEQSQVGCRMSKHGLIQIENDWVAVREQDLFVVKVAMQGCRFCGNVIQ